MQDKTSEIPIETNTNSFLLMELGIKKSLALYYEKLDILEAKLDFSSFYNKLSMAMSANYFKAPLQCINHWQILVLSGLEFDSESLNRWIAVSDNPLKRRSEIKDNWGATALHYLAWAGNINNLQWILKNCFNLLNKTDKYAREINGYGRVHVTADLTCPIA